MSEFRYTTHASIVACLIVLMNLGAPALLSQGTIGAPRPRPSAEDEKRRTEEAVKRMNQPEARRERQLLTTMEDATERYYRDKDASSRQQCESLMTEVLALPKPGAKAYSACATTANALGRPRQAIEIIKKAISEYPDESGERTTLPLRISGYFRIGALATRVGDVNEATRAYEVVLTNIGDTRGHEHLTALCHMYLADLIGRTPGQEHVAIERLQQVMKTMDSVNRDGRDRNDLLAIDLMKNWARHELARLEHGIEAPGSAFSADVDGSGDSLFFVATCAIISCPSQSELEQMAESDRPSILRDLAGLLLALDYAHRSNLPKVEECLLRVAEGDSFFKARARIMLDRVREQIKQMHERIPALVNDLRHGSLEQQEQAASQLKNDSSREGIKVLQDAQEDPDKRVRSIAACALATQYIDQSVKPRFDPILDALADEEPRIRKMGESAMAFGSRMEIGDKELTAMVERLHERYTRELLWIVLRRLGSSQAKPELTDAAVLELTRLINHESKAIRDDVLNAFDGTHIPPAQMAAGLAQCLDKEQDSKSRVRITEILSAMGPAAKDAVPVLIKYVRHDDPNISYNTALALERIAPEDAARLLREIDKP